MEFKFRMGTIVSRKSKQKNFFSCVHAHTHPHAGYTNEPDVCSDTKPLGNYLDYRISKSLSPKFRRQLMGLTSIIPGIPVILC